MARKKKSSSSILAKAETRLAGIQTINAKMDFGNGMSAVAFEKEITTVRQKLADYNKLLSKVDDTSNELEMLETKLKTMTSRMLSGVASTYGRDSSQYEMAGGVRTSDRRKRRVPEAQGVLV